MTGSAKGAFFGIGNKYAALRYPRPTLPLQPTEAHLRLDVSRGVKEANRMLEPIAPALRGPEREANAVLSGWKKL